MGKTIVFIFLLVLLPPTWTDVLADDSSPKSRLSPEQTVIKDLSKNESFFSDLDSATADVTDGSLDEEVEKTIELLEEGEQVILLGDERDVTVVLGMTGAGKTTVTQLLAGDNSKLHAVKVGTDFIIIDENGHIGNSTIKSMTIIPELVVNKDSGLAYYDCPGFSDTRDPSYDIAASYFVNKVFQHVNSIKLLFTIDYYTLRTGVSRSGFTDLLKHVSKLINVIDQFNDGISMVATKVDNQFEMDNDGNIVLVPDTTVISSIAKFMTDVRDELQSDIDSGSLSGEKYLFNTKAIKIINIFLTKDSENFTRIGLIRRPMKEGPLSEDKIAQQNRDRILYILDNEIDYVTISDDDFSNTISDNSKLYLISLDTRLSETIISKCNNLALRTNNFVYNKCQLSNDLYELSEYLYNTTNNLLDLNQCYQSPINVKIINDFFCSLHIIGFKTTLDEISYIVKFTNFMDYFENFNDDISKNNDFLPIQIILRDLQSSIQVLNSWYVFTIDFYYKISEYEFQKYREKYNVQNIEDWGISNKPQGITITKQNIRKFLENLEQYKLKEYNNIIKQEIIEDFIIKEINNILKITLKNTIKSESSKNGVLTFTGENIVMTEIIKLIRDKDINFLQIFAINTIYIDTDINDNGIEMQIVMIAPKLTIQDKISIKLQGVTGEPHDLNSAIDGKWPGDAGENGKPGNPGKAAGSFMAVANNFVNDEHLTVNCKGGEGGKGQNGGDGVDGQDGKPIVSVCKFEDGCNKFLPNDCMDSNNCKLEWTLDEKSITEYSLIQIAVRRKRQFKPLCYNSGEGGNGGDGGASGLGGNGGEIFILNLQGKQSKVIESNGIGPKGGEGMGGKGGKGGSQRSAYYVLYGREAIAVNNIGLLGEKWLFEHLDSTTSGLCTSTNLIVFPDFNIWNLLSKNGEVGISGKNDKGIIEPLSKREFQKAESVNLYKYFLRDNLDTSIGSSVILRFYYDIESNADIQNIYKILDFIHEIKILDSQFKEVNNFNLIIFYENLMSRIIIFSKSFNENVFKIEDKMILNYIYSTTLSKYCAIKSNMNRNLVIDLMSFIDLASNNIEKMKELEKSATSLQIRTEYKESIQKKILEASKLIDGDINSELSLLQDELDTDAADLLNEVIELKKQAEENKKKLLAAREQMKRNLEIQKVSGIFGIIGSTVSAMGPYGAVAGAVISGASQIAESVMVDTSGKPNKDVILPGGIQNAIDKFEQTIDTLTEPTVYFKRCIANITDMIADIPEIIKVRSLIVKIKSEITSYVDYIPVQSINKFSVEITNTAISEEKDLKRKYFEKENATTASKVLKTISVMNVFVQSTYKFVKQQAINKDALEEINTAIEENNKAIEKLNIFEDEIYSQFIPLMQNLLIELKDAKENLESKSHVSLDVKKYGIQKVIRKVKYTLEDITQGFKSQENFMRTFLQLEDAMNLCIQLFDRIQSYKEQEELADYIADLTSIEFKTFKHLDPKYEKAVNELELVIASNTVIEHYNRAVSAFKMQVFPFALRYSYVFDNPLIPQDDYDLSGLTHLAVEKFKSLKQTYKEIQSTIVSGQDENIYFAEFDSQYNSSTPFYVWENREFNKDIKALVEGKYVAFKANILNSRNQNAIKFNKLELKFKCFDDKLQKELNEKLMYFDIELLHSGDSYYQCNGKYFIISGESQLISYSFQKDVNNIPIRRNVVYNKILNGDILISPYTLWNFRLANATSQVGFTDLAKFAGQFDLELAGRGLYVKPGLEVCETPLEKFYDVYEINENTIYNFAVARSTNW